MFVREREREKERERSNAHSNLHTHSYTYINTHLQVHTYKIHKFIIFIRACIRMVSYDRTLRM